MKELNLALISAARIFSVKSCELIYKSIWLSVWEKILLEFSNCKYLPQGVADIPLLFIIFARYSYRERVKFSLVE